jgi:dipeptidyl aminopeptidase/acylaminoacyl peptidase
VVFTPDGKSLVTASGDKTVRLWDVTSAREVRRFGDLQAGFRAATVSPDGRILAAAATQGRRCTILLWETATGQQLHELEGPRQPVSSLAFAPDGKTLVSGGERGDGEIRVWDVETGKQIRQFTGTRDGVNSVAWSPDGTILADGEGYCLIVLRDAATGRELHRLTFENGFARSLSFSPDGRVLASAGGLGGEIHLWEVATGGELAQLRVSQCIVNTVAFAPDNRFLASGGQDNKVRLWDTATLREVQHFTGHQGQGQLGGVLSVAFSPDGRTVASSGDDTTALLWDVSHRSQAALLPPVHLTSTELDARWVELGGQDAGKAHRAGWALVEAGSEALALVHERLRPAVAPEPGRVAQLLADLDSNDFQVRDRATRELREFGRLAEPALRTVLEKGPPAETRRRVAELLDRLQGLSPDELRALRAVAVLERVDSIEARQDLQRLADGAPSALVTREAKAARARLARR